MKSAIEWFEEKGFSFNDKITIKDVIDLQNDARKDGLMSAQLISSEVINRESPKYAQQDQKVPAEMTLSGLNYFVSDAITSEADKLDYLPGKRR